MKQLITFACGCEKICNVKDDGSTIEFLENQKCSNCKKLESIKDGKFPKLVGTEKQINWAREIRWNYVKANYHNNYEKCKKEVLSRKRASDWICFNLNGYFEQSFNDYMDKVMKRK